MRSLNEPAIAQARFFHRAVTIAKAHKTACDAKGLKKVAEYRSRLELIFYVHHQSFPLIIRSTVTHAYMYMPHSALTSSAVAYICICLWPKALRDRDKLCPGATPCSLADHDESKWPAGLPELKADITAFSRSFPVVGFDSATMRYKA